MQQTKNSRAICSNCKYFYITWDRTSPYGCKAMGFKSKTMPYMVTRQISQTDCQSYEVK